MLQGLPVLALTVAALSGGAESDGRPAPGPVTFRSASIATTLEPAIFLVRRGGATISLKLQRVLLEPNSGRSIAVTGVACSGRLLGGKRFEGTCGVLTAGGLRFDAAWTCAPTVAPTGHTKACEGEFRAFPSGGLVVDGSMLMVFDTTPGHSSAMIVVPRLLLTSQR